jgi:hypothetical protein
MHPSAGRVQNPKECCQHVEEAAVKATVTRDLKKDTGISVNYKQTERIIELSHTVYIDAKYPDPPLTSAPQLLTHSTPHFSQIPAL